MDELLERVRAGKLAAAYVLSSDQPILLDRVIGAIRDQAVPPAMRGFNYDVLEGKPTANRIIAAAATLPMMAPRRMVYVRDLAGLAADDGPALLAYLQAPNPSTVLVLVTSKLDKRLKLYAGAAKLGLIHVLEAPRHIAPWISAEAKHQGVRLTPDAVARLVEAIGADLSRLVLVIGQLGLYAGDRPVTVDDIDDLVADTRERTVFELTDAIGAAQLGRALDAVAALADQRDSAIGVIALLGRHMRQLAMVHDAGVRGGGLAQALGVPPFIADKLAQQARNFPAGSLAPVLGWLADADRGLKGDPTVADPSGPQIKILGRALGERLVLERLVVRIVGLAGHNR